jgi:excisionase family DNA binding protein
MTPDDAPRLSGWLTPTEVAELLGVSRQTVNQMIRNGDFDSLHLLGPTSRPQYVVADYEVAKTKANRTFPRASRA